MQEMLPGFISQILSLFEDETPEAGFTFAKAMG